ncbi:MAG: protein kinase domain-containing protein [Aulosira sp. ZfuVER01]|nr:serine/threonine-protein kinase [Aulosira sp. ZfuVER01]MDZ7998195.1 serine/threonine-protein kinase [Aulosira sp. DedVER01a]MDZ8052804.1 serine/threonine-protein kinase [Aulosira sp. ZfuCHP01]
MPLLRDRYRVLRLLGGGGFGRTYLAEDTEMPSNRRCVIKQLKPIASNSQIYQLVQERFQREAAILEQLGEEKDQIPRLYAYFTFAGNFYLIQQWIDGETLAQKVQQQGALSESAVKDILASLLSLLDYVHLQHIIHRDIKPDNIILRLRDGKPVLIDFGAVKEVMGTVVNSQGSPTSSIVIGTPGFMPSEQAAGRPLYSSDLYSLGLTAIYALTQRQPQELDIDHSTGEIFWHRYASNVSQDFAKMLDKAIRYHPRERYPSARDMLNALQLPVSQTLHSRPIATNSPFPPTQPVNSTPISLSTSALRQKPKFILVTVSLLGLVAIFNYGYWHSHPSFAVGNFITITGDIFLYSQPNNTFSRSSAAVGRILQVQAPAERIASGTVRSGSILQVSGDNSVYTTDTTGSNNSWLKLKVCSTNFRAKTFSDRLAENQKNNNDTQKNFLLFAVVDIKPTLPQNNLNKHLASVSDRRLFANGKIITQVPTTDLAPGDIGWIRESDLAQVAAPTLFLSSQQRGICT